MTPDLPGPDPVASILPTQSTGALNFADSEPVAPTVYLLQIFMKLSFNFL